MNLGKFSLPGGASQPRDRDCDSQRPNRRSEVVQRPKKNRGSQSSSWALHTLSPKLQDIEEIESPSWNVQEKGITTERVTPEQITPRRRRKRRQSSAEGGLERRERKKRRRTAETDSDARSAGGQRGPRVERYKVQSLYGDDSPEAERTATPTMVTMTTKRSDSLSASETPRPVLPESPSSPRGRRMSVEERGMDAENARKAALIWISPVNTTRAAFDEGNALLDISNHCSAYNQDHHAEKTFLKGLSTSGSAAVMPTILEDDNLGVLSSSGSSDILGNYDCSPLLMPSPLEEDSPALTSSPPRSGTGQAIAITPLRALPPKKSSSRQRKKFTMSGDKRGRESSVSKDEEISRECARRKFVIPRPVATATGPGGQREFSLSSARPQDLPRTL